MSRTVRCGLIQAHYEHNLEQEVSAIKDACVDQAVAWVEEAAERGAQLIALPEFLVAPYFPVDQDRRWFSLAEQVPSGPTIQRLRELATRHRVALVVPVVEEERPGVYFATAAVIDADGAYLGKYRKAHIPQGPPAYWEKFYFSPGNLGFPVFRTQYGRIGVGLGYDRRFPEVTRGLGLAGAEIVLIPGTAWTESERALWEVELRASAVANGLFVCASNRAGERPPGREEPFFGGSCVIGPDGVVLDRLDAHTSGVLVSEIDLSQIALANLERPFYRDRRPILYGPLKES